MINYKLPNIGTFDGLGGGDLLFSTYILSDFHFNKMSDSILYESFRIMQAKKTFFQKLTFLMERQESLKARFHIFFIRECLYFSSTWLW